MLRAWERGESAFSSPTRSTANSALLQLSPTETRTWPWGKMVAIAMGQAAAMVQGGVYDAGGSDNDSHGRDLLVQEILERLVGRGQSPRHGSCQLLKTSSPPACRAEPYTPAENQADGVRNPMEMGSKV